MNRTTLHQITLHRISVLLLVLALAMFFEGCGGGKTLLPVTGSLLVDGKAAEGATLLFHPKDATTGSLATATTDANGNFSLVSNMNPGIVAGSYKVCVVWPDPAVQPTAAQKMTGMFDAGPDLLKGRYESPEKSMLVIEIDSSKGTLQPFKLSTK